MDRYLKEALLHQNQDLEKWKKILNPYFYKELEWRVVINNEDAFDYHDIIRGDEIIKIVKKVILELENKNKFKTDAPTETNR